MKPISSSLARTGIYTILAFGLLFGLSFPSFAENTDSKDPLVSMFATEKSTDSIQSTYEAVRKETSSAEMARVSSQEIGRGNLKSAPSLSPAEIAEIKIEAQRRTKDFLLNISWKKPKDSWGNILKQLLYVSEDKGKNWGTPKELNQSVSSFTMTAKPNTEYYVKITTVDTSGHESEGIIQKYKVPALVSTGSPLFLSLGVALLLAGAWQMRRNKIIPRFIHSPFPTH